MQVPHCVAIGNDGWCTYATTGRPGSGVRQNGTFQKEYLSLTRLKALTGQLWRENSTTGTGISAAGVAQPVVGFSPDQSQRFMFVLNEENEQVDIFDHASGKLLSVSDGRVTRRVNFRMATPWPWTPRATSSSLRSASETRQATEFRNSGSWRAGRCRSRSPKFCPPVIPAAYTVAVDRQDAITLHMIGAIGLLVSAFLRLIHTHRSPPSLLKSRTH